ncbi:MAG TPA: ribosome silencing factor [Bacteroidota bacterium]|nr:ribosome silencing factor [Bacteroidota bacterium]
MTPRALATKLAEFAISRKASDVVLMDLKKFSGPADYFVICTADSDTQVKAIADAVRRGTEELGMPVWHVEGLQALSWVLLDYVDVVLHIFLRETRSFYNLERLWNDAKLYPVIDTPNGVKVSRKSVSLTQTNGDRKRRVGTLRAS